jgi:hypothetical protein
MRRRAALWLVTALTLLAAGLAPAATAGFAVDRVPPPEAAPLFQFPLPVPFVSQLADAGAADMLLAVPFIIIESRPTGR